jgi:hypothetical protein
MPDLFWRSHQEGNAIYIPLLLHQPTQSVGAYNRCKSTITSTQDCLVNMQQPLQEISSPYVSEAKKYGLPFFNDGFFVFPLIDFFFFFFVMYCFGKQSIFSDAVQKTWRN